MIPRTSIFFDRSETRLGNAQTEEASVQGSLTRDNVLQRARKPTIYWCRRVEAPIAASAAPLWQGQPREGRAVSAEGDVQVPPHRGTWQLRR